MGSYEYNPLGQASVPGVTYAPTAAGYTALGNISTFNQTNLGILKQYLPPAPVQGTGSAGTTTVCSAPLPMYGPITSSKGVVTPQCAAPNVVTIPIGTLPDLGAEFLRTSIRYLISLDYDLSSKDQLRGRYVDNKTVYDPNECEPADLFRAPNRSPAHLGSFSEFHSFTPSLNNEFRLAYNRFNQNVPIPSNLKFPGLDQFPNLHVQRSEPAARTEPERAAIHYPEHLSTGRESELDQRPS